MYLLDTNVLSNARVLARADKNVVAWLTDQSADDLFLSVATILEIELGMLRLARRDRRQGDVLRRWIEGDVLTNFAGRILTVDTAIARQIAALHVPNPRPERDAMIAATALVHNLIVVTRNVADFAPTGVRALNPWDGAP